MQQTLLLGGKYRGDYLTSMELVSEDNTCEADMPSMPEGREKFGATLMGKTLLYCGGCSPSMGCEHSDCHSLQLDKMGADWEDSFFMVVPRYSFAMVAVQGKAYAVGGNGSLGVDFTGSSVEEFTPGGGWQVREDMRMPNYVFHHCAVAIRQRIIVIGGYVGGGEETPVLEFDLDQPAKSWTQLRGTRFERKDHSCAVGSYQGQEGIFVTGGVVDGETTVEFLIDSIKRWRVLQSMSTSRENHVTTFMGGTILSLGGSGGETSFEKLNTTSNEWTAAELTLPRRNHIGVSLPAGTLQCHSRCFF